MKTEKSARQMLEAPHRVNPSIEAKIVVIVNFCFGLLPRISPIIGNWTGIEHRNHFLGCSDLTWTPRSQGMIRLHVIFLWILGRHS
jgi:hypothetical protein